MSAPVLLALSLSALLAVCPAARAQLFRAYLAPTGSDSNPCTLQAPCRLLPAALNAVADGGEIWMQGSANYNSGKVQINKSVSILAVPGVVGSVVSQNNESAFEITADNLTIALRNLVIGPVAGAPEGTFGVRMTGASTLTIENSLIANLFSSGVVLVGSGKVRLANTMLRNNGGWAVSLANGAKATVASSQMVGNYGGVLAYGAVASTTTTASITDSIISDVIEAVRADAAAATAVTRISVTRSTIERSNYALVSQTTSGGTAELDFGSSMIVDNWTGWYQNGAGATLLSLGNNQMHRNENSVGIKTVLAPQ